MNNEVHKPTRAEQAWEVIGTTWRSYVAEIPAWAIVIGAMAVSFWTQVLQVQHYAFAFWEALIWGSSTDFGTLACLFLAREGAHRGTPTWGAWVLSVSCAFMSVQFNVVAGIERGDWLAVESHVWMPALALGVWYWTLHGRHRRWSLRATAAEAGGYVESGRAPRSPRAARPGGINPKILRIIRANPRATWRVVMHRTGLSEANSKRALTDARKALRAAPPDEEAEVSVVPIASHSNGSGES